MGTLGAESEPRRKLDTISPFIKQTCVLLLSVCGRLAFSGEISSFPFTSDLTANDEFQPGVFICLNPKAVFHEPIVAICSYFSRKICDFTGIYASL